MIPLQIVADPPVALVGALHVDLLYLIGNPPVIRFAGRDFPAQPLVVCRAAHMSQFTKRINRISVSFVFFFDRLIDLPMPDQAQPRLLSISSSFFKNDASISARSFSARSILFSARSLSNSDISSNGFERPRLSCNASTPPASYLTV